MQQRRLLHVNRRNQEETGDRKAVAGMMWSVPKMALEAEPPTRFNLPLGELSNRQKNVEFFCLES